MKKAVGRRGFQLFENPCFAGLQSKGSFLFETINSAWLFEPFVSLNQTVLLYQDCT